MSCWTVITPLILFAVVIHSLTFSFDEFQFPDGIKVSQRTSVTRLGDL